MTQPRRFRIAGASPIDPSGQGGFATEKIAANESILVFSGRVVTKREMVASARAGQLRSFDDPLQVGRRQFLLLESPGLFFNHSCQPNALLRGTCELFAIRDIEPGEEILYDYASTLSARVRWQMVTDCRCGTAICRRRIGNIFTLPTKTRLAYRRSGGLQDFIREEESVLRYAFYRAAHATMNAASVAAARVRRAVFPGRNLTV